FGSLKFGLACKILILGAHWPVEKKKPERIRNVWFEVFVLQNVAAFITATVTAVVTNRISVHVTCNQSYLTLVLPSAVRLVTTAVAMP
uniref:Uncharacterized protein n=1 Tax=Romanomermis culicivorax TaxID=13658 RepID=A0A915K6S6_ROMCU